MERYLVEACDNAGEYFHHVVKATCEQEAEQVFCSIFSAFSFYIVEITNIGE